MNENEVNSKPRRAQGGKGLLSRSISVQSLHKSIAKIPNSREEKRGTWKRGWRQGERWRAAQAREREREGEGMRGFLTPTTLNPKD